MLQRFLIFWLILLSAVAWFWPRLAGDLGIPSFDPFVRSKPALSWLIATIMFSVGCLLPREEVRQLLGRWPSVLWGTCLQYTSMPLLAFSIGHLFQFDQATLIGVVVVGCVPGAMASNVLTLLARGNVSYSVSLTTCSTLLSPLVVPLALWLALGKASGLDPLEVAQNLVLIVSGPVLLGFFACRRFPDLEKFMQTAAPILANLTILWVIAVVVALNRDRLAQGMAGVLAALLLINLLGYAAGYLGGAALRLPEPMRRALTLEIGMQNAGLGTTLVLQLFPTLPTAAIPPAIYTFACMLTGTLLAHAWSWSESRRLPGA